MKFPENLIKIAHCLNCNNLVTIFDETTKHCGQCDIFFRDSIIFIYLNESNDCFYTVYSDGQVDYLDKRLFLIDDCSDFKAIMNRIYKLETFK